MGKQRLSYKRSEGIKGDSLVYTNSDKKEKQTKSLGLEIKMSYFSFYLILSNYTIGSSYKFNNYYCQQALLKQNQTTFIPEQFIPLK